MRPEKTQDHASPPLSPAVLQASLAALAEEEKQLLLQLRRVRNQARVLRHYARLAQAVLPPRLLRTTTVVAIKTILRAATPLPLTNRAILDGLAQTHGVTISDSALAWHLSQRPDLFRRVAHGLWTLTNPQEEA